MAEHTTAATLHVTDQDRLTTLFDLGRQVAAVLNLDELLAIIPKLIARLMEFHGFGVYLLDEKQGELRLAYAVGYPETPGQRGRVLKTGEGLTGAAVAEGQPILVNDVCKDPRYVEAVPGTRSELVVPLRRKGRTLGTLNVLSRNADQYNETDLALLRQFGAHVSVAIENARLFEQERAYAETLETLAEIGREAASILDLDELLTRLAQLVKRVVAYRTFGILLIDEQTGYLEMRHAVHYGEAPSHRRHRVGEGLSGYAALHRTPVLVADVTKDPRYIKVLDDVRSELVVPLLVKDRCIGVFDLDSPEVDAFSKSDVEILTLLASHAAVAIENARLYEEIKKNEVRLEKELRFAQRVQMALLPTGPLRRVKGVDVGVHFSPARELGGDIFDFLLPDAHSLVVAVGDVSGKGVPAALYGAVAGELVRSRTFRRRIVPEATSPAAVLASINTILHERQLEEYYCTLCYAWFDLKRRTVVVANSGLPYPIRCTGGSCAPIEIAGVPLGSFGGSTYDEVSFELASG
ncbi:MAG: GAF domain-containing protein, partial [Acidobacteria bacterium]